MREKEREGERETAREGQTLVLVCCTHSEADDRSGRAGAG